MLPFPDPSPTDPAALQTKGRSGSDDARWLCFGGSFNPIHFGHLRCAKAAAEVRGFDAVLLIPTAQPPHKPSAPDLAPAEDRLAMATLGADWMNKRSSSLRFEVDDLELRRSGPSYTLDTARELKARGWPHVWWLIGADMLNYLPKWHQADKLLTEVRFLVMARPGFQLQWDQLPLAFRRLRESVVVVPAVDVSGTDIRQRIREGKSIDGLTPPTVIEYIRQHQLYR